MLADSWLVVMDEPSSALSRRERDQLYALIGRLRGARLRHPLHLAQARRDLHAGRPRRGVARRPLRRRRAGARPQRDGADRHDGRPQHRERLPASGVPRGAAGRGRGYRQRPAVRAASLTVHAGEVVALAGLMGSGRSEVLRCIAGMNAHEAGRIASSARRCARATRIGPTARRRLRAGGPPREGLVGADEHGRQPHARRGCAATARPACCARARSGAWRSNWSARLGIAPGRSARGGAQPVRRQPAEGGHRQVAGDRSRACCCSTSRRAGSMSGRSPRCMA